MMRVIRPGQLWIGNALDLRDPKATLAQGVEAVVDLAASEPPAVFPRDIVYARLPLCDGGDNGAARLQLAVTTTVELLRARTPTLVACSMGMSRSPAIAAAALARVENRSGDEVLAEIGRDGPLDVDAALWGELKKSVADDVEADRRATRGTALSLLVVKTEQVAALLDFYGRLGLRFSEERHGSGPLHHAAILERTVFEIYPAIKPGDVDAATRLGFRVDDPMAIVERLRAAGAPIVSEPKPTPWGLRAVVRDPDGRAVELNAD